MSIAVTIVAVFITLLAALPAVVWVLKRYPLTLWRALLSGVLLRNIPTVLGTIAGGNYGLPGFVRVVMFASFLGLGGATAFWAIWRLRNPALGRETT
jgi:hypothetical protein